MKVTEKLLTRLEGEVRLKLIWKDGKIKDAFVTVPYFRGFEKVLEGRPVLDALVITPRICGICNHAHLMAAVKAIEDLYKNNSLELSISRKADTLRKVTLFAEMIQNHIRWFYLYLMPDLIKLDRSLKEDFEPLKGKSWRKGLEISNKAVKVIALFGGQWPHTSYALPGGVACDPTNYEVGKAVALLREILDFFKETLLGMDPEEYVSSRRLPSNISGDLGKFLEVCSDMGLDKEGKSYGRFVAGGKIEPCFIGGTYSKKLCKFDPKKVKELEDYTFTSGNGKAYSWARTVRYNGLPYETGPLGRQLVASNPIVRRLFKTYGDSCMVRVFARMDETVRLVFTSIELLEKIDLKEKSYIEPKVDIEKLSGRGVGVVEASRGTLIHRIEVEKGIVKSYDIVTPTVWNLGPRDDKHLGVAEKAMIGLDSEAKAHIVLRSFDVCSVCTSH